MAETLNDRWNRISLRTKITGVTVLMLTLGLLVAGFGTTTMLGSYIEKQVDARLQAFAQSAVSELVAAPCSRSGALSESRPVYEYYIAVFKPDGVRCDRNWKDQPNSELPQLDFSLTIAATTALDGHIIKLTNEDERNTFHAMALPVTIDEQGQTGTVLVAVSMRQSDNTMRTYFTIFAGFGLGVVLIGAALTRILVTSTFTPLREVERTAAAIADGDFSQRLSGATPNTEVGRLSRSLNTMLNRIDRAFKDRARTIGQMRRFVGDASHELRTPLVTVRGYAELYRMGALQTPDEVAQAMERIEKEAIRMGGLVEDLLELARLDETKPLKLARVDLVPLARDAALDAMASSPGRVVTTVAPEVPSHELPTQPMSIIDTGELTEAAAAATAATAAAAAGKTSARGGAKGQPQRNQNAAQRASLAGATLARFRPRRPRKNDVAPIEAVVAPEHEQPIGSAFVMAEENKIRQVITNLMGNAMRFTPNDSPLEIRVSVDSLAQTARLEIVDHGEGIPPAIREKIFQRFWRADTSRTRETGGSGLGLAIVSSIVAAHNGVVDVVETEGGGATFRITLPLAGSSSAPQPLSPH